MSYPLEILLRDQRRRPRAGVLIGISLPDDSEQQVRTGGDGIALFQVPEIAHIRVTVEGNISVHSTRLPGGRVERIAMTHRAPRVRSFIRSIDLAPRATGPRRPAG
jgi:hypothetical protein